MIERCSLTKSMFDQTHLSFFGIVELPFSLLLPYYLSNTHSLREAVFAHSFNKEVF